MLLLIDKPKGITSHDVVDHVRKVKKERKVGHAGTLDPLATGLMIVGVGRSSTKKLGDIAKGTRKTYIADITLGETRETDDAEGEVIKRFAVDASPDTKGIEYVLNSFKGKQEQMPPVYSAIKVNGKPAHRRVRAGEQVKLKKRTIEVFDINLIKYEYPLLVIETEVSSGTYIRALARDIGEALKTGGYLSDLKRTQIGQYELKDATPLSEVQ